MKVGFALVELLIATVIAAIISTALFVAFNQINKYVVTVDDFTDISLRGATLHQQLEKDLSGTFAPLAIIQAGNQEPKKETPPAPAQPQLQTPGKQPPAQAAPPPAPAKPKEKIKPLEKVFYSINKDTNLDVLSFITGNSLQTYWSKNTSKPKPRMVRVVYRLQPDKEVKNSFNLMRQEGTNLYFDNYKPGNTKAIREFTMVEGIKSLQAEYWKEKKQKEDAQAKTESSNAKKKKEFSKTKEWKVSSESKKNKESAGQKEAAESKEQLIPDYVVIKGELWDSSRKFGSPFEFKFELNSHASSAEEKKPEELSSKAAGQKQARGPIYANDLIERFPTHLADLFKTNKGNLNELMQPQQQTSHNRMFGAMQPKQGNPGQSGMFAGKQYNLTPESNKS